MHSPPFKRVFDVDKFPPMTWIPKWWKPKTWLNLYVSPVLAASSQRGNIYLIPLTSKVYPLFSKLKYVYRNGFQTIQPSNLHFFGQGTLRWTGAREDCHKTNLNRSAMHEVISYQRAVFDGRDGAHVDRGTLKPVVKKEHDEEQCLANETPFIGFSGTNPRL